jgi:two-component system cell cycle sensor histidine kinase/response regulator CckA
MAEPIRILFVEDVPSDVELAARTVRNAGMRFESMRVETEAEFVAALDDFCPDIVVSDYSMPQFDAMRALEICVGVDSARPFIVLTGSLSEETAVACVKAGATDYVMKERIGRLPYAITEALAQRDARRERKTAESALRSSEARLASIFRVAPVGIGITIDRVVQEANDVLCQMLGYAREELIGHNARLFYPSDEEYEHVGVEKYRQIAEGGTGTVETRWRRKDGRVINVLLSSTPLDPKDHSVGVTFTALDITERKRAEDETRENAHFLQNLIDTIPSPVFYKDTQGVYQGCNAAFADMVGLPREQIVGATIFDLAPQEQAERGHKLDQALLERGGVQASESQVAYADGAVYDVIYSKATFANVDGAPAGLVGVMMDISESKRMDKELRFRNLILSTQQEASIDGILVVDESAMIVSSNHRFAEMWNIPEQLFTDRVDEPVLQQVSRQTADPRAFLRLARHLYGHRTETGQGELKLADGRLFDWYSAPMFGPDGHYYGRVWYYRDVSERHRAELEREGLHEQIQQIQKMESVGQLAGGVAHDFNNILMVQKGYCELMRAGLADNDPLVDSVAQIEACTDRATALTRQLLAFSRKQTLQPRVLDLGQLVQGAEDMLRRLLGEHVEMVIVLSAAAATVKADPGQIEQVLVNLAANARDAMPQGGRLTINLSVVELDSDYCQGHVGLFPGAYVMLSVSDTGSGMDAEVKRRMFEPFYTTKGEAKGTGLGLSTAHGIVRQSGGDIWVESEPGKGATFRVCLPLVKDEPVYEAKSETTVAKGEGELVLVVEDESALRGLAMVMIERLGYRVAGAANGAAALGLVVDEGLRPDLILTDVVMPGMSGHALAERLSSTLPDTKVVYMSGYTDDAIAHHGVLDPGIDFLQKPFAMADLAAMIRSVLARV